MTRPITIGGIRLRTETRLSAKIPTIYRRFSNLKNHQSFAMIDSLKDKLLLLSLQMVNNRPRISLL